MSALYIASCDHFRHFRSASEIESGVTKPTGRGGRNIPPTVSGPEQHTQRSVGKGLCRISPNFLLKKQEVTSLLPIAAEPQPKGNLTAETQRTQSVLFSSIQ